jgi:hypothetical protein
LLNNQSNRLADLGRREDALAAMEEAVTIRHQLTLVRPGIYTAPLKSSLKQLADILTSLGRASDAASAAAEAAQLGSTSADPGRG